MAGSGPPPKPAGQVRRRNAPLANTTRLPAGGCDTPAPKWPLGPNVQLQAEMETLTAAAERLQDDWAAAADSKTAAALAKKLETAQIRSRTLQLQVKLEDESERVLWAELWSTPQAVAWHRMRWTREVAQYVRWKARAEGGDLDASKEARQLADRLGLSPLSLLRLRWEIVADEVAEQRASPNSIPRTRLKVVAEEYGT